MIKWPLLKEDVYHVTMVMESCDKMASVVRCISCHHGDGVM